MSVLSLGTYLSNLKSVALTILELLAFNAQKFGGHVTLDPTLFEKILRGHVQAVLTQYITVRKQPEHFQRFACLYNTGAKRTTPTAALEIITGIVPLAVYIKREAMVACFRLKLNSQ